MRVGNICTTNIGLTFKPSEVQETGIPIYKANNIKNGKISTLDLAFVSEKTIIKENEWLNKNDILMAVRSGSKQLVGKTAIVGNLKTKTSFGAFMSVIRPISVSSTFMNYFFQSSHFRSQLDDANTTTIFQVTQKMLKETLLPLPSLAEQKRIVAQIERALKKVEIYAESYNQLQKLDKIFPDKLKKSILQYAMQGKLVEQDPNDESVEVLLEKIRAEKQKLFEEGKIKKKDLEISIVSQGDDNSYYEQLPRNWMFSTLDSVSNLYTGNSINATEKKKYFSGVDGINYIATKDVNFDNTINYDNGIRIPDNYLSKFKISYFNSVLLCLEGGSAGRKIGLLKQDVCFGNKLCNLSFYYGENKFLYYFLQSPQFLSDFQKNKSGIIGGVSIKNLGNIPIPILPINEQNRITQKVEKLFEKVNQF
ncbi:MULTISPECIES: restriction endonuclease subunit S [Streptococcus]|uniref:restriction endonuclease subunit S n=1 Tax=Streptococcus sp. SM5 TaxID=2898232 RepID=UPI00223F2C43